MSHVGGGNPGKQMIHKGVTYQSYSHTIASENILGARKIIPTVFTIAFANDSPRRIHDHLEPKSWIRLGQNDGTPSDSIGMMSITIFV